MKNIILVGLGGFIGAASRYKMGLIIVHLALVEKFPLSTCIINILGCFLIGLISGFVEKTQLITPEVRLLLMTGVLGGFTTFSTFGLETFSLIRRNNFQFAFLYVGVSVGAGIFAVWLGLYLSDLISSLKILGS